MSVLQYLKSVAFHTWLFGIEVTGAAWVLQPAAHCCSHRLWYRVLQVYVPR